uniref:Uncharacterized protein n=1 Tax=Anguilla anguilla TaxID=7936 RepID=A0A0E9WM95_ANGAN
MPLKGKLCDGLNGFFLVPRLVSDPSTDSHRVQHPSLKFKICPPFCSRRLRVTFPLDLPNSLFGLPVFLNRLFFLQLLHQFPLLQVVLHHLLLLVTVAAVCRHLLLPQLHSLFSAIFTASWFMTVLLSVH